MKAPSSLEQTIPKIIFFSTKDFKFYGKRAERGCAKAHGHRAIGVPEHRQGAWRRDERRKQ